MNSVVWHSGGERLASGSDDTSIRIWEVTTGREEQRFDAHRHMVNVVSWDPEEKRLASGSFKDSTLRIWDCSIGKELYPFIGSTTAVNAISLSGGEGYLMTASNGDTFVRVWEVVKRLEVNQLAQQVSAVNLLALDEKGTQLATYIHGDAFIQIWDTSSNKELCRLKHGSEITSMAWNMTGERLAFGEKNGILRVWSAIHGRGECELRGHKNWVTSVAWNETGKKLASGSLDAIHPICIWDTIKWEILFQSNDYYIWGITSLVWMGEDQIASGSYDKIVRIWDTSKGQVLHQCEGHKHDVTTVVWNATKNRLISGSRDRRVKMWDIMTGKCLYTFKVPREIRGLQWKETRIGSLLAVVFDYSIVCYLYADRPPFFYLYSLIAANPVLHLDRLNMTDSIELDISNEDLLRQRGAIGLVSQIVPIRMNDEEKDYFLGKEKHPADESYLLGICYRRAYGVTADLKRAFKYFQKAAKKEHPRAQYYLALMYKQREGGAVTSGVLSLEATANTIFKKCFTIIKNQAESKTDAWAAYTLACMYQEGEGTAKDSKATDDWFKVAMMLLHEAAKQNVLQAQASLAISYEYGEGVEKDFKKAVFWYQLAARGDYPHAQYCLARCYKDGNGEEKNLELAKFWFTKAFQRGIADAHSLLKKVEEEAGKTKINELEEKYSSEIKSPLSIIENTLPKMFSSPGEAQFLLAEAYQTGEGVDTDLNQAVMLCHKAASLGYPNAQNNLGVMYCKGMGLSQNYSKAFKLISEAAKQGYLEAEANLGYCYEKGYGTQRNLQEAVVWYLKAANRGHHHAAFRLGLSNEQGALSEKNIPEAIRWFRKAAASGHKVAIKHLKDLERTSITLSDDKDKLVPLEGTKRQFKQKLASLCGDHHYKFVFKRPLANKLLIQVTANPEAWADSRKMKDLLIPAVDLLKQMIIGANIPMQQWEVKPNWDNGLLTITAERATLDRIARLLQEVGLGYFPSVTKTEAALFYTKKMQHTGPLSPGIDNNHDEPTAVTCMMQ